MDFLRQNASSCFNVYVSWYSRERTSKTDREEKKLLNEVIIFVYFAHKKSSCSFVKLWLNHWRHMDYFNDVLTTFLGLERGSCVAVYGGKKHFLHLWLW